MFQKTLNFIRISTADTVFSTTIIFIINLDSVVGIKPLKLKTPFRASCAAQHCLGG